MNADHIFLGPCRLLVTLLRANKRAERLYDKLYNDRLVVSTTRMVDLQALYCTQMYLDRDAIAEYVAQPRTLSIDRLFCVSDLPVVVRFRSRLFVLDGHHRLAAKMIQGQRRAKVYFWDLDAMLWGLAPSEVCA